MKAGNRRVTEEGFSLIELMVSLLILLPIMGAAVSILSVSVQQHAAEQSSGQTVQDARAGMELMVTEITQAGSHRDVSTTLTGNVPAMLTVQSHPIGSTAGINVGDRIQVGGTSSPAEEIDLTAVGANTISGIFRAGHSGGEPVRLFALPFKSGILKPAGLGVSSSTTVTTLRFFGDIKGDGELVYIVYTYDSTHAQITRSMTPVTQSTLNTALPIISNIKPSSVGFALYTDAMGVITSVRVSLVVQNTVRSGGKLQETALTSRVLIPSAVAASSLVYENVILGTDNPIPPTPANVVTWASQ